MDELQAVQWKDGKVLILDQQKLPNELVLLSISDYKNVVNAIKALNVRGAPAIGIAAAYGVVLSVWHLGDGDRAAFLETANQAINDLKKSRPTAKNLFWALEKMRLVLSNNLNRPLNEIRRVLLENARRIHQDDIQRCKKIGEHGAGLIAIRSTVLTHCNAGALATGGYGTALGVIRAAEDKGKKIRVYATETRPLLQGARLTAFELMEDDIDVTLVCDSMVGYLMQKNMIDAVVVGADRIARNGDVANKIGTYSVAVLAKQHSVPFYVAAPLSTFDFDLKSGEEIPIEERHADEIRQIGSIQLAPEDVAVLNPAFDVTPASLTSAIITEKGVLKPPYPDGIDKLKINS
ncbi:S-methyl-5-thioribose-1-phosphate isomerase [candidate division KSB1 bacterium]|nr:S-methyl-5-thioribose-1-phosphate isomerase [candidate division KSB1 bacterium]